MSGRVIAIVPARGGSKGIPRKNVRDLAGHPLIAYSIAAAQAARTIDRIIVSTDDDEIAAVAAAYGAEVPFRRPPALAADDTPDLPVFAHALEWLGSHDGVRPEIIVQLRPTSPLRQASDIDRAVSLLDERPEADSVRAVCAPFQNPFKMWRRTEDGWLEPLIDLGIPEPYNQPHQQLPRVYWQTGYIDALRARTVTDLRSMTGRRILPLILDEDSWIDIDTPEALAYADFLIRTGRVKVAMPRRAS